MKKNITHLILFTFFLYGCGEEINFSTGATKGGSGTGSFSVPTSGEILLPPAPTPTPSEGNEEEEEETFHIISNGKKEMICGNNIFSIQPIDIKTKDPIDINEKMILPVIDTSNPINFIFEIKIRNLNNISLFEHFKNCKPNIELQNQYKVYFSPNQQFLCPNSEISLEIKAQETKTLNFETSIPLQEQMWNIYYTPIFSLGHVESNYERNTCGTLNYELKVKKQQ